MRVVDGIYRAGEGNNVAELLIRPDFVKCFRVLRSMTCAKQKVWCISRAVCAWQSRMLMTFVICFAREGHRCKAGTLLNYRKPAIASGMCCRGGLN
jgi:hypothetical protein